MIEVLNLTKVYGRRRKKTCALDGVSFTLPDRGFVFVVGKSGCGKSTLLNLIGGCDRPTSGEIIVDGNKFSTFHERDFDHFRNDHVGFIFQDYCLLEGLTVEENVALALELKGEGNAEAVKEALGKVELKEYAARLPSELSGGQKQRVAIARTLVKKPKLVLADEPTGNLDEKSSRIVLGLLQEISKEALVVIVSHNRLDAEEYADRIIELSEGKVVGDFSRNPAARDVEISEHEIVIQRGVAFTEAQLEAINARLKSCRGGVAFKQTDDKFLPTIPPTPTVEKKPFRGHRMSMRGRKMLFALFAKKRAVGTIVTALTIAFLIMVMGVCQLFTQFSPDREIARILEEEQADTCFIMQKGYYVSEFANNLSTDRMVRVTDADIAAFRDTGYEGGIYPLYNVSVMSHTYHPAIWGVEGYSFPEDKDNYANFYCGSGLGVLVTNRAFLERIYGENGKLNLLSGTLETEGDKLIVTDYFADSFLTFNPQDRSPGADPYANITTGRVLSARFRIACVIGTGYKERYGELLNKIVDGTPTDELDLEAYAALLQELDATLNIAYSFNPDFCAVYSRDEENRRQIYYGTYEVSDGTHVAESRSYCNLGEWLKPGEILMRKAVYASMMHVNENMVNAEEALGKEITITRYDYVRQGEPASYTLKGKLVGLMEDGDGIGDFTFCKEDYMKAMEYGTAPYALYFDDMSNITELYDAGTDLNYTIRSPLVTAMYTVAKAALVFLDFFEIIIGVMLGLTAVTLIAFGVGSVRKNMYDIAVVRALGGKSGDLTLMFVVQMLLVSLVVCIVSVFGLWLGAGVCNTAIVEGFVSLAKNVLMLRLRVIVFDWGVMLRDALIVFVLTVLAAVAPLFLMRKAKPREIIRAKE